MSALRTLVVALLALACSSIVSAQDAVPFSLSAYEADAGKKGVVLVAANWARRWKCAPFENAQLRSLGFDRLGVPKESQSDKPDLVLEDSSWLPAKSEFVDLALLVEPGEYLLSAFKLKAAKSVNDVGFFNGDRSSLIADGKSKAGSFTVAAGEVVYIGHFAIDCTPQGPMPWRFYLKGRQDFKEYLDKVQAAYPGLPTKAAKFRLFETSTMGNAFTLK
jgi:hypothetical protein